jgi:DNA-binding protein Fis
MLWELLSTHDWSTGGTARIVMEGTTFEVIARRVLNGPRAHFVVHYSDLEEGAGQGSGPAPPARPAARPTATPAGAGAIGTELAVVEGPPGSGRATAARSLHAERTGRTDLEVVTVSTASDTPWTRVAELLAGGKDMLLRRAENIPERDVPQLAHLIMEHRAASATGQRACILLLTLSRDDAPAAVRALIGEVSATACTETLARTPERIPGLVKRILERVDPDGRHTMSPAALQSLVQWSWPGNITELADTLATLVRDVHASVIHRRHLPLHLQQAPPRRHLTLIEAAEREAIIRALAAADGNKSEAAGLLGIGRTTLYRRLRQLGLADDEGSL